MSTRAKVSTIAGMHRLELNGELLAYYPTAAGAKRGIKHYLDTHAYVSGLLLQVFSARSHLLMEHNGFVFREFSIPMISRPPSRPRVLLFKSA